MDRPSSSGRTNESAPQSTCIPGYILSEKLGAGSYATVYKAKLKSANAFEPNSNFAKCFGANPPQIVAVKCIDAKKCASEAAKDNLIREIGLLKRLRHRHIVTLYDFHWDANYIYLVLEYCAGGDLSLFIREHRILPEAVARKFLKQLASALFYLRTENIAHMDLKPQNLLLTDRYRPILKVGDFGFAQSLAPYELRTTFKGSPLYMAPEMFQRPVIYDAKVDLWSVGVILYECLFGKAPFASETYEQLIRQIISREEIVLPQRSPPLSLHCLHLLHALLQRDPRARINFDQFFMHRFIALLQANQRSIWHCANNPDGSQKLNAPYSSGVDASYLSSASFNYVQLADEAKQAGANAEKIDSLGQSDVQNVVDAYCTAVDRHLRALQCCDDPRETAQLRQRAAAYLRRAETLKSQLKSRDRSSSFDNRTQSGAFVDGRTLCSARESATKQSGDADFDDVQNVLDLWKDVPQVREQLDEVLAGEDETERMLAQTGAPGHAPCALM